MSFYQLITIIKFMSKLSKITQSGVNMPFAEAAYPRHALFFHYDKYLTIHLLSKILWLHSRFFCRTWSKLKDRFSHDVAQNYLWSVSTAFIHFAFFKWIYKKKIRNIQSGYKNFLRNYQLVRFKPTCTSIKAR